MTIGAFHQQQIMMQNSRNYSLMNIFAPPPNQNHHLMDTKGLLNGPGQNNCFLNCAVQVSFYFHSELTRRTEAVPHQFISYSAKNHS